MTKITHSLLALLLGASLLSVAPLPASAAQNGVAITIDGQLQSFEVPPVLIDNRVYVPIRALLEAFGYTVEWDADNQSVSATKGKIDLSFSLAHGGAERHDPLLKKFYGDPSYKIVNGRSLISVRSLSEIMGADISWDATQQTVRVDTSKIALFEAIMSGDYTAVRTLLDNGADPNSKKDSFNATHYAVASMEPSIVKLLASRGATNSLNSMTDLMGSHDLPTDVHLLKELLLLNSQDNGTAKRATAMLPGLVYRGGAEAVHALLALGADPNAGSQFGDSALGTAVYHQDTESVQALLEAGADPNVKEALLGKPEKATPILLTPAEKGNLEILNMLLEHHADPNATNPEGWTPLMVAANRGDAKMVQALLQHGADVHLINKGGATALAIAKAHGNAETAGVLMAAGATELPPIELPQTALWYDEVVPRGKTELINAAINGQTDKIKTIAPKIDPKSEEAADSLIIAVINGQVESVKAIFSAFGTHTPVGSSTWYYALQTGNTEIIRILAAHLLAKPETASDVTMNIHSNNVPVYQTLLEVGAKVTAEKYKFPLWDAAWNGYSDVVRLFLQAGADPNVITHDLTPVSLAVKMGNLQTLKTLLISDKLSQQTKGDALIAAVNRDSLDMVSALLQAGADLHFKNGDGLTALQAAEEIDNSEMLRLLTSTYPID